MTSWILVSLGFGLALYAAFLLVLLVLGRRADARAWGGLVPDCVVLIGRLLSEGRLSRRQRALLLALVAYLALPFDIVPDFIPVAGQLDDVLLVALVLRHIVRRAGAERVRALWPGPAPTGDLVLRLAGVRR
ncbi:MAG TPA: YkvA family protein [Miltoncostaeaceae bacterium]|nr:YkvA family protein [Miltoncostaeaceae bacterium]